MRVFPPIVCSEGGISRSSCTDMRTSSSQYLKTASPLNGKTLQAIPVNARHHSKPGVSTRSRPKSTHLSNRAQEPGGQPLDLTFPGNDSEKAVRSF
jgi:hypothetical protein